MLGTETRQKAPPTRVPMLSELQEKKLTRYFQVYDIDDDGEIAAADFERVIENVRILRGAPVGSFADHGLRYAFMAFWGALISSAELPVWSKNSNGES